MFNAFGKYFLLMKEVLKRPDKSRVFWKQLFVEFISLGVESLGIIAIISVFMGAVVALQTAYNIDSPLIPLTMVGFTARQSIVLEFSPTIIRLILAGKVGSRIASEIGTMRVTEQIDALQIMGVNSANYLILPKVVASMLINPFLISVSMFLGILGGWLACISSGLVTSEAYIIGSKPVQAEEVLNKIPQRDQFSPMLHKLWGDLYNSKGMHKEALEEYRAASLTVDEDLGIEGLDSLDLGGDDLEDERLAEMASSAKVAASEFVAKKREAGGGNPGS